MNTDATCTSVFKNGDPAPTSENFTQVWIDLINQIERNKVLTASSR